MRKISVLNQKGGVGKTTTAVNMAAGLVQMGLKVVVIDLDPQAHLTIHFGVDAEKAKNGSYALLTQSAKFDESLMPVRANLWLMPANIDLVGAESELVSIVGRETILREAIEASEQEFDYLIIDCAPSLGLLTLNALAATDEILIPIQPHFLALQGFGKLLQTVELVNKRINPDLKVKWVLLCMFDSRASLTGEVKADIEQFLTSARGAGYAWSQAEILPVSVRRNIKLAEAPSYGKTIFEYEKNCHGAQDYAAVAEIIHTGRLPEPAEMEQEQKADEQGEEETVESKGEQQAVSGQAAPIEIKEIVSQQKNTDITQVSQASLQKENIDSESTQ